MPSVGLARSSIIRAGPGAGKEHSEFKSTEGGAAKEGQGGAWPWERELLSRRRNLTVNRGTKS